MAMASSTTTALMVLLLVVPAVYAADYPVAWSSGVSYDSWGSDKTLVVGDTITFTYGGSHGVDVVNKGDYDSCSTGNALKTYTGGNTKITLDTAGPMYFVCPTAGHCDNGMKLAVTVTAGGTPTTPTTPTTPSTPSGTPTPNTPSPPSTSTPTPPTPAGTGAATSSYNMNYVVIGASLLLAPLFALMG
ncbi:Plastocyanin-like [Macleaya cordata]|uniref:Plastocyanin-like n=1 Tax=Macleaya cordata TaxID=56857 RepID=A0A200QBQ3_MACCD|nr:Plastocyanin-like [Macleaya cordata]